MWSNTISFYIFFKENGKKISLEKSHQGKSHFFFLVFYKIYLIIP
jgi:hypothetical protein